MTNLEREKRQLIEKIEKQFRFTVAGYSPRELTVSTGISRCGHIKDGISLEHGDQGGWVLAFKDLEEIYMAAKAFRREGGWDE